MSLTEDDKRWLLDQLTERRDEERRWALEQFREHRELLEAVETRLLTEFHKWASPMEARQRTHTATLRAIDLELESLNERVKRLEEDAA